MRRIKISSRVTDVENLSLYDVVKDKKEPEDVIRLNIGETDFKTPQHIVDAAKRALDMGYTHYTPDEGIPELREEIAKRESERLGVEVEVDNVIVTDGASGAIFALLFCTLDPNDEALIQSPWYPGYYQNIVIMDGKPIGVTQKEESNYDLDINSLQEKITDRSKIIVISSPNNPTGAVLDRKTLKIIADLAVDYNLLVLSDEVYGHFVYDGVKFGSIASILGVGERVVVVNSLSKTYAMSGWRVGYAIGPRDIVREMLKVSSSIYLCTNSIAQYAALEALKGPKDCVERMVNEYDRRRRIVIRELSRIRGFKLVKPKGAFYVFPNVIEIGMKSMDLARFLVKKSRVLVTPGYPFFGPDGENHIRIAFTTSREKLKEAMLRIREAIETIK